MHVEKDNQPTGRVTRTLAALKRRRSRLYQKRGEYRDEETTLQVVFPENGRRVREEMDFSAVVSQTPSHFFSFLLSFSYLTFFFLAGAPHLPRSNLSLPLSNFSSLTSLCLASAGTPVSNAHDVAVREGCAKMSEYN